MAPARAIHPQHDYFLVAIGGAGTTGRVEVRRLTDGALLASVAVGTQPDSVAIAPLIAVGLERANAVALIDVSEPAMPTVIDIAAVDAGPEGIKFFRRHGRLFVASANEVAGTVSLLEVVFDK